MFEPDEIYKQYSNEGSLYISDEIEISELLKINIGFRYSSFQHSGNINIIQYLKNHKNFKEN